MLYEKNFVTGEFNNESLKNWGYGYDMSKGYDAVDVGCAMRTMNS